MVVLAIIAIFALLTVRCEAQVRTTITVSINCTNENISVSSRCTAPVDWFMENQSGGWYGQLTSGVLFSQFPVTTDRSLHKMTLEDAFWYINADGAFWASDDMQALSIHLSR